MTSLLWYGFLLANLATTSIYLFSISKKTRLILFCLDVLLIVGHGSYHLFFQGLEFLLIGLGFLGGQFSFFASLSLVNLSPGKAWKIIYPLLGIAETYLNFQVTFRHLIISGFEEVFWRGTVQDLLGNSTAAVLITSIFFALRHLGKRDTFYLLELLDLFLFSCLLGILFVSTHSIYLVIVVHAVRNINLSYLRHRLSPTSESTGDKDKRVMG